MTLIYNQRNCALCIKFLSIYIITPLRTSGIINVYYLVYPTKPPGKCTIFSNASQSRTINLMIKTHPPTPTASTWPEQSSLDIASLGCGLKKRARERQIRRYRDQGRSSLVASPWNQFFRAYEKESLRALQVQCSQIVQIKPDIKYMLNIFLG